MADNTNVNEALVRSFEHTVTLPAFEGPLDLLLFLIRKSEVDIYDIPISTITRQYLDILHGMQEMKLDVAGEFFVMAATLMYIKSRMLLPKDEQAPQPEQEDDDSDVDPRWELVQQLIEYKKFKEAAAKLDQLAREAQDILPRYYHSSSEDRTDRPLQPVDRIDVWNVFNQVLRRLSEKITVGQIQDETITVAEQMEDILQRIQTQDSFLFTDLFAGMETINPNLIIASFLAILELTRLKKVEIEQHENFADILCRKRMDGITLANDIESIREELTYQG